MARKRSRGELEAELQLVRAHGVGNNVTKIIRDLIKYGAAVLIVYWIYLSIDSLSGKITIADIDVRGKGEVITNSDPANETGTQHESWNWSCLEMVGLAVLFGVGGVVYGRKQARLRKDVVERLHPYQKEQELAFDPKRSSSDLTARGDTRQEDI